MNSFVKSLETYNLPRESRLKYLKTLKNDYLFNLKEKLKQKKDKIKAIFLKIPQVFPEKIRYFLLIFIRTFYEPKLMYVDDTIKKWIKDFVKLISSILINGFVSWLAFSAAISIFPIIGQYIYLGPGLWNLMSIIYLGIFFWFIKGTYRWFRLDYKKGGK